MIGGTTSVLIVEDHRDTRDLLETVLSKAGFEVRTASHGVEALRSVDRSLPDLIVLDLMLPWVNGVEVLATLRGRADLAGIPVLVTTGTATSEFDLRAFRPLRVMRKPFQLDAVIPTLQALLLESRFT